MLHSLKRLMSFSAHFLLCWKSLESAARTNETRKTFSTVYPLQATPILMRWVRHIWFPLRRRKPQSAAVHSFHYRFDLEIKNISLLANGSWRQQKWYRKHLAAIKCSRATCLGSHMCDCEENSQRLMTRSAHNRKCFDAVLVLAKTFSSDGTFFVCRLWGENHSDLALAHKVIAKHFSFQMRLKYAKSENVNAMVVGTL